MEMNRDHRLGLLVMNACMLFVIVGCDNSVAIPNSPGTGGSQSGGSTGLHTQASGGAGGTTTSGAITGTGGTSSISGGGTGCSTPVATKAANCGTPTVVTGSFTVSGNYFSVGTYAGYGYDYISPTPNPADSVTCSNSTFGSGTLTALCGAGVVPSDCSTNAVGGVGFNLAQPKAGGDPAPAITTTVQRVIVTFTNTANSDLHIQIVKFDGTAKTDYCYAAKGKSSPLVINAADFTTTCYLPDTPGSPWDGTGAESFQLIVPSRTPADGDTHFDLCIQNVEFS